MRRKWLDRVIDRECVVCGESLKITYNIITKHYVGGHYFFGKGTGFEYWECDICFVGDEC